MRIFEQRRVWIATAVFALLLTMISVGSAAPMPPQTAETLLNQLSQETGGHLRVSYHKETGQVRFLATSDGQPLRQPAAQTAMAMAQSPEMVARRFLQSYGLLFGLQDSEAELALLTERTVANGRSFSRFQQLYQGVPVIGGELIVQTNNQQAVLSVNGELLPELALSTSPAVGAEVARETAVNKISKDYTLDPTQLVATEPELWVYDPAILGGPDLPFSRLVWRLEVSAAGLQPVRELVLVDAQTGIIALHFNQIAHARNRIHYDNNNNPSLGLPGNGPVRSEGSAPTGIADIDLAYDYAGDTYDFFFGEHQRDSLDGNGMALVSTTRYCPNAASCPFANAFWDGSQMVYGAGFSAADDVVAHELTHGFTEFSSNLFYWFQSGAINESMSDVWGEFVDQTNGAGNDADNVRWLIGEDVPGIGAIRSMKNPPDFNDPDRMGSPIYLCEQTALTGSGHDNGGVHVNSGVNNKAVFLMVEGGSFNGFNVSGIDISRVADLYYEVQTNLLTSAADYADLYDALLLASSNLDFNSAERQTVQNALNAVEMNQSPSGCAATEAPVCGGGQTAVNLFSDNFEANFDNWQVNGSAIWQAGAFYATSGSNHLWGQNSGSVTDGYVFLNRDVAVANNSFLRFKHAYGFESNTQGTTFFDGGVVEYSTNGGGSWNDAGSLFTHNGYVGTIGSTPNPLNGRSAFVADSSGYLSSRLNLNSLAGQNVRFRFRIGTDNTVQDYGWFIDDVAVYRCDTQAPRDNFVYLPALAKNPPGNLRVNNETGGPLRITLDADHVREFATGTTVWETLPSLIYNGEIASLGGACGGQSIPWTFQVFARVTAEVTFTCGPANAASFAPALQGVVK